jgi:hypothetical protein
MAAAADPHKDESGHGHGRGKHGKHAGREYKEKYWDGNCKVERKFGKNGEYKEERKCQGGRAYGQAPAYGPAPVHAPVPVYGPVPGQGIVIQGTVRVD